MSRKLSTHYSQQCDWFMQAKLYDIKIRFVKQNVCNLAMNVRRNFCSNLPKVLNFGRFYRQK